MPSSTSSPVSSSAPALEVRGLTGPVEHPFIHDVDVTVQPAATDVLLGPIHSGKTLLLRHLVGLECASHGAISIAGERFDPTVQDEPTLRRMRTRIGVVFEGSALISRISVVENVELPLLEHAESTPAEARDAARELLAEVGLQPDDDLMPLEISRAERRRVALARAMALRPPIILLDEPSLGLDSHSAAELDDTIQRVQERHGFGILVFSHEVRHAFGRVQEIYVMADGYIVDHGTRDSLRQSDHQVVQRLLNRRGS